MAELLSDALTHADQTEREREKDQGEGDVGEIHQHVRWNLRSFE